MIEEKVKQKDDLTEIISELQKEIDKNQHSQEEKLIDVKIKKEYEMETKLRLSEES